MTQKTDQNIFDKILEPVISLLQKTGNDIEDDQNKYILSFVPFTMNLLFGIICNIKTRAQLITEIKTSPTANNSMTYRLKPVDCMGRERPLRLKSSKLFG